MGSLFSRAWAAVAEPRRVTIAMSFAYGLVTLQGVLGLLRMASDGVDIELARVVINVVLFLGGVLGFGSCPRGYWLFEKPALLLVGTAYFVHLTWVGFDIDQDGLIEPGKIVRISLVLILLYVRYEHIRGSLVDPLKE